MSRWAGIKKKVSHTKLSERWMVAKESVGWRIPKDKWVRRITTAGEINVEWSTELKMIVGLWKCW